LNYQGNGAKLLRFANLFQWPLLLISVAILIALVVRSQLLTVTCFFVVGFGWANVTFKHHYFASLPSNVEGKTIQILGVVQGLPNESAQHTKFLFKVINAQTEELEGIEELRGQKIQLNCYRCDEAFLPDQQWRLLVRLKKPHGYASWGAFDYEKYLFRHKIIATGYVRSNDKNYLLKEPKALFLSNDTWRWRLRESLQNNLESYPIGEAIIGALLIGDKSRLRDEQKLVFQKTGTSHLMAISGLHIGLAFFVMTWFLKWFLMPVAPIFNWQPRQIIILFPAFLFAFLYAALAGFAISTQRAIIMLLLYVLIKLIARDVSLLKVLLLTVFIIFVYDPFSIFDIGFWLSCSAVFVIAITILHKESMKDKQAKSSFRKSSNDKLSNDLSHNAKLNLVTLQPILWLGMLPVTLLLFGKISLLSPFINLIMVPLFSAVLIPFTLFSLMLQLIGFTMFSNKALIFLSMVYENIFHFLEWVSQFPLSQVSLPPMQLWHWLLFLVVVIFYFCNLKFRHVVLSFWCVSLFLLNNQRELNHNEFNVALLDVGQGLSVVVEGPDYILVYDTGAAFQSGFNMADAVLIPYLHLLIISHADNDHIGGFQTLNESFDITQILTSHTDEIPSSRPCKANQSWSVDYLQFKMLSPKANSALDKNNDSCVLLISNAEIKVLFTGDIEKRVEDELVNNQKTSSSQSFIAAVQPQLALISAGYRNRYGHPHEHVLQRYWDQGIDTMSTTNSGSILLNIKKNSWDVSMYRSIEKGLWNRQKNTDFYKK